MKRGQVMGLPLVLLFALIVGGFILAYGVKVSLDLVNQGNYVELLDTIDDLDNSLATFGNYDEGSAKVYELDMPSGVDYLCFYDSSKSTNCLADGGTCSAELEDTMDLILDTSFNVYVIPQGEFDISRFSIESFATGEGNPDCVSDGNSVIITAEKDDVSLNYYA